MPVYRLKCENGHEFDRYLKLDHYNDPQICECGKKAKRIIMPVMLAPMFEDYQSPIDGRPITSKQKRHDDLRRNNCIEYDPGMLQDYNARCEEADKQLDKKVDAFVEKEISSMSSDKRNSLARELSGTELKYERLTKE